jgi:hypothetical protein
VERISGPEKFGSSAKKDFFNTIGQKRKSISVLSSSVIAPKAETGLLHASARKALPQHGNAELQVDPQVSIGSC